MDNEKTRKQMIHCNPPMLELLASFAKNENFGMESSVTLQIGGFLVSGTLISKNKYLEKFKNQCCSNIVNESARETIEVVFNKDFF